MVLVYLTRQLGDLVRANVDKYSSTMEHMGYEKGEAKTFQLQCCSQYERVKLILSFYTTFLHDILPTWGVLGL